MPFALDERGVGEQAGEDVGDAVAVAGDVDRRVDRHREVAVERQAVDGPVRVYLGG